ncbi:MAG: GNAT family N-acetyltransferase [Pseudomonadota bacterium]
MTAPTLHTDRLTLRHHRLDDFQPYAAIRASSDSQFMGGPYDRDRAWGAFCSDIAQWELLGFGAWAVDLSATDELVAQVGLNRPPSFPEREIGWVTYPNHRGHGYATEAARAVRTYAFDVIGWDTLVSYIDEGNAASIAVAEKLGAVRDPDASKPDPEDIVYRHRRPA